MSTLSLHILQLNIALNAKMIYLNEAKELEVSTLTENIIGKRMRSLREAKDLKQIKVAASLSVSPYQWSRYENGKSKPDPELIAKIATYYDCTTDYLLGKTDKSAPNNTLTGQENNLTVDKEFEAFANNPDLERWYKDLPNSEEEDLEALKQMWDIIKKNKK